MKSAVVFGFVTFGALVTTQAVQSKPFNLVLQSDKEDLNGRALATCHTGAAVESICVLQDRRAVFHLNTTQGGQAGPGGIPGILTWTLPTQPPTPSSMSFYTDPSTNVALPLFYPGASNVRYVGFDDDNLMNIVSYLDDTKSPPDGQTPHVLKRWYVCTTYNMGYTYQTLTWVLGNANPQNPSCASVNVKRKFV
ncbi:uncharacterized protein MAM_04432 [Metarhizium album ARSEF 1941]|uniref:DUF7907 domain-containing protein n=1 Tax=Metarhizium album (strain ARSEF 1941) TaxID=1081103 RepID=A0A0B2WVD8_METAS|nr:uncharacterized protein MAM_04432 [Metarhizium album ARSEF 1941]KHN97417.1 hypothetical protein MAM_04432 [Metarhizium album ARSEF 1941]